MQFVVFSAERLKGVDSIQENLNDAVLLQFAGTDNFGTKEQHKKSKGLIGDFDTKKGKHCFNKGKRYYRLKGKPLIKKRSQVITKEKGLS